MSETKVGDRVRLVATSDPYTRLRPGDEGLVTRVGRFGRHDIGNDDDSVHVTWDDGSRLTLLPSSGDRWEVVDRDPFPLRDDDVAPEYEETNSVEE